MFIFNNSIVSFPNNPATFEVVSEHSESYEKPDGSGRETMSLFALSNAKGQVSYVDKKWVLANATVLWAPVGYRFKNVPKPKW